MTQWVFGTVGCAALAFALLWQPPFARELIVCGMVALMAAAGGYFQDRPGHR